MPSSHLQRSSKAVNEDAARGGPAKQLTPEEEAKANQKPLGKKGAIAAALNIAADAFAGMAGQKGGYTAAQFDKRRVELKDAAETIRKERARLEGEQEKAYNRKRQEQLDILKEKEVNAQIEDNRLRLGQNYEIAKARLEQAKTEGERKAAKDEVDRLVKESQIRFKEATIEKLKKNGTVIQPGGQYAERDPISGQMVVVLANELQTVTTTDQSNTKTFTDPATGKTYTQKDDTTTTTRKGTAPAGAAPNGASGPTLTEGDKARGAQLKSLFLMPDGTKNPNFRPASRDDVRILHAMGLI